MPSFINHFDLGDCALAQPTLLIHGLLFDGSLYLLTVSVGVTCTLSPPTSHRGTF